MFFVVPLLLVFAASYYFLGAAFLIINLVIFFALSLLPLTESAQFNALQQVWTLGLILYEWHKEDPTECAQWVERGALRPLYNAVIKKSLGKANGV